MATATSSTRSGKSSEYGPGDTVASVWRLPSPTTSLIDIWKSAHPLRVYNSLTRSKVPFIPMRGRQVLWYMCGPTVYDSAHMGHARTYVTFDVLRRVLSSFFGYDVLLTMNITDIDDKIIKRSNEAGVPFVDLARRYEREFLTDMTRLGVLPPDVMTRVSEYVPEIIAFIERIISNGYAYASNGSVYFAVNAYSKAKAPHSHVYGKLVPENVGNKEALEEGEGVLTNAANAAAAAAAAGAAPATAAGAAPSAGAADKRDSCDFALWKASKPGEPSWPSPWGEGRPGWHIECSTMCTETLGAFAGGPIDIHSGGVDLRFPHHDNEIAQSEAYLEHGQWVNYFLHTGHLHIEGLKMAKSLKNFITIGAALERYGARALRLLFLLYRYNAPMDYSDAVMDLVAGVERPFVEFFAKVKGALRSLSVDGRAKWGPREHEFAGSLEAAKEAVRAALADDFDTPTVIEVLRGLVKDCNKYMAGQPVASSSSSTGAAARPSAAPGIVSLSAGSAAAEAADVSWTPVPYLLRSTADYVTHIFRVFGLVDAVPSIGFGFGSAAGVGAGEGAAADGEGASKEAVLGPYLDVLATFRESVRDAARAKETGKVLAACDHLRDALLPPLGVVLEDSAAAAAPATTSTGAGAAAAAAARPALWKLRDPAELRREAEDKARKAADKVREKAEAEAARLKREADKLAAASVPPADMFRAPALPDAAAKYSAYDAEGLPTHDAAGAPLGDKAVKKLRKDQEKQRKEHEWYLSKTGASGAAAGAGAGSAAAAE